MIPTVEDIVDGLLAGKYNKEQAMKWLEQHINSAIDEGAEHALLSEQEANDD